MSLVSEDSSIVKDNQPNQQTKPKPGWPIGINDGTKPCPSKRAASGERFTDMDVDLLKSIIERLAKLDVLDILREDVNALCARL